MTRLFPAYVRAETKSFPRSALIGLAIWLAYLCFFRPGLMTADWGRALLALATLTVVPLAFQLLKHRALPEPLQTLATALQLPAALLVSLSLTQHAGTTAAAMAIPWLLVTLSVALEGALQLKRDPRNPVAAVGMIYLAIGGVWTLCDRAAINPLGFDREIGLLTAIHFHYAGFALPILANAAANAWPNNLARRAGLGTVVAVPALAIGITASHFGAPSWIETMAAWCMAAAALAVALVYVQLANRRETPFYPRLLWNVAAMILAGAMLPAIFYGVRGYFPIDGLDIPLMRVVHGTANALGFTLPALIGWQLQR